MPPNYSNPYVSEHEICEDGSVTFRCTRDAVALPWLSLAPHHPIVIQTQAFWTAVGASIVLEGFEATQWTALTWIRWQLGDGSGGHATHGIYRRTEVEGQAAYEIVLFNEEGAEIVRMEGRGVVFRNRNFEKWREGSKQQARTAPAPLDFTYADSSSVGLKGREKPLVGLFNREQGVIEALVTKDNGLAPGNPLIGGSGDHVNSTHFHELARQALCLIKGRSDFDTSGEMSMKRYVELGTPILLRIVRDDANEVEFALEQLGRECAQISLSF